MDEVYSINEMRSYIAPIAIRYRVERVYLFGSYAKGCATSESDIDLRIDRGRCADCLHSAENATGHL